jgi:hypothetical protein
MMVTVATFILLVGGEANSAKATRLIANTSIRMLRYGETVSWPSTS